MNGLIVLVVFGDVESEGGLGLLGEVDQLLLRNIGIRLLTIREAGFFKVLFDGLCVLESQLHIEMLFEAGLIDGFVLAVDFHGFVFDVVHEFLFFEFVDSVVLLGRRSGPRVQHPRQTGAYFEYYIH